MAEDSGSERVIGKERMAAGRAWSRENDRATERPVHLPKREKVAFALRREGVSSDLVLRYAVSIGTW